MGVVPPPTSDLLNSYIAQEERRRRSSCPDLPVSSILRYGAIVGCQIETFASLPRAMDEVRSQIAGAARQGGSLASGTVLIAETLTQGKGRFQRAWHAPSGGLWLVVALFNQWLPASSQLLPLAAGMSACESLRHFGLGAEVKWVNDVLVEGKKICGILCETTRCPESAEEYVLVGIGINVNNSKFPAELNDLATSMQICTGQNFDLAEVAIDLLAKLRWNLGLLTYEEEECASDHSSFMASYRNLCSSVGRRVSFGFNVQDSPQYRAKVKAIADDGGLVLQLLTDNAEIVEHAGEIIYID